jgi:hypothetical protein
MHSGGDVSLERIRAGAAALPGYGDAPAVHRRDKGHSPGTTGDVGEPNPVANIAARNAACHPAGSCRMVRR